MGLDRELPTSERLGRVSLVSIRARTNRCSSSAECVHTIEVRRELKIARFETGVSNFSYMSRDGLLALARHLGRSEYGAYFQ
jgi:hypothetical protein